MPTPIESALTTLLPTTNFLPPELLHFATFLLAQSRSKAASLKPEEEIARVYVCCHIACERLRNRLALEIGKPTPPVPPRIYKKLFTYLDSAVKNAVSAPSTPRAKRTGPPMSAGAASASGRAKAGRSTGQASPSKSRTMDTSTARRPAKGVQKTLSDSEASVPKFVMPMARHICSTLGTPDASSHLFAGAASVIREQEAITQQVGTPNKKRKVSGGVPAITEPAVVEERLPALLIVLHLYISTRMQDLKTDQDDYLRRRARGIAAVRSYYKTTVRGLPPPSNDAEMVEDIEAFMRKAQDGWLDMEWYQNVPQPESAGAGIQEVGDSEDGLTRRTAKTPLRRQEKHAKRSGDDFGGAGLLPGLGTMFQPAIDWLSDERRASYIDWKNGIMHRLQVIESSAA